MRWAPNIVTALPGQTATIATGKRAYPATVGISAFPEDRKHPGEGV